MANKERVEVRVMSPEGPLWLQHRKNPDVRGGPIVGGTVGACSDNGTSKPRQQIHRERCSKHGGIGTLTVASQNKPLLSLLWAGDLPTMKGFAWWGSAIVVVILAHLAALYHLVSRLPFADRQWREHGGLTHSHSTACC